MLWELRLTRDGFSIQAAVAKGRELPDWYIEEPSQCPGDQFYIRAFFDLSTCRSYSMSAGPIPWTAIIRYAEYAGLEEDLIEPFVEIIKTMDSVFIRWLEENKNNG